MNKWGAMAVFPAMLTWFLSCVPAQAVPVVGQGRVNMAGSILDTACAIEAGSMEQTLDMGVTPLSQLVQHGSTLNWHKHGPSREFAIRLVNCVLEQKTSYKHDWQYFLVTFEGPGDGKAFGVTGDAKGVALQIRDSQGNLALPGVPLPRSGLIAGSQNLNFTLSLVGNRQELRAGDYRSTLRFKMDYD